MKERFATEVDGYPLSLTNLQRPLFANGFTKGELVSYYLEVAAVLLPYLAERPLTRVRYPQGTLGEPFYEKNAPAGRPGWVDLISVIGAEGLVNYVHAHRRADLVWLANLAAIELHAPQWVTADATAEPGGISLEGEHEPRATNLMIDLDPGDDVSGDQQAKAALLAATLLAELGLECFPKTSGSKGIQLSAPIQPTPATVVLHFARSCAQALTQRHPDLFVATVARAARPGKVFVDYAQNLPGRNTICAYSVRGLSEPAVSAPLTWEEVAAMAESGVPRFSPTDMLQRVSQVGDLWRHQMASLASPPLPSPPF